MNTIIVAPVRLLGEGLASSLSRRPDLNVQRVLPDLASLRAALPSTPVDVVLVDVTQGVDLEVVRGIASDYPNLALVAFGLAEQRQDVIRCGRAGFAGYIGRDADVDTLYAAVWDVVAGRLACPAEISGGLLRALFRGEQGNDVPAADDALTRREREVLHCIGRGLSNKEIARELCLSVATVKHHVHNVLAKMNLHRRAQAMRSVRDGGAGSPDAPRRRKIDGGV